jgi:hypothetical protein
MAATNTMKVGGVLIVLILGFMLFVLWRREFQGVRRNVWDEDPAPVESNIKEQSL